MSAKRIPTVDDRLQDAQKAFATLILIAHALSSGQESDLPREVEHWAWTGIHEIAASGYEAVTAAYQAGLDLGVPAPAVEE